MNEIESRDEKKSKMETITLRILLVILIIYALTGLIVGSVILYWSFEISRDWDFSMTSPFNGNIEFRSLYPGCKIYYMYTLITGAFMILSGVVVAFESVICWMILKWKQKIPKSLRKWLLIKIAITLWIFLSFGMILHMIIA